MGTTVEPKNRKLVLDDVQLRAIRIFLNLIAATNRERQWADSVVHKIFPAGDPWKISKFWNARENGKKQG